MELKNNKLSNLLIEVKINYAISLIDSLLISKSSANSKKDLDKIWKVSGFKTESTFKNHFKKSKGISFQKYCEQL
ncbi:MAG: hypothetical protein CND43_00385 [Flavobacteriales bacterium MED-G15]|nr:MAG: hypothetical protein CND43_00385 [Flavobacteriales bacterium MED-G15]